MPSAGTSKASGISITTSGVPICQPSLNRGAGGNAVASPSGAPASTHRTIVSFSASVSPRAFEKVPTAGSACQGGISPVSTLFLMDRLQGRASS